MEPEPELEVNPPEEMDFNYDIPDIVEDDEDNPHEVFQECKLSVEFHDKAEYKATIFQPLR